MNVIMVCDGLRMNALVIGFSGTREQTSKHAAAVPRAKLAHELRATVEMMRPRSTAHFSCMQLCSATAGPGGLGMRV